jgi:hypothetical protein
MRWLRNKWIVIVAALISLILPSVSSYSVSPAKWEVYMYEDYEITPQTKLSLDFDNYHNTSISIRLSIYTDPAKTTDNHTVLPEECFHWIRFAETDFTIPPKTKYSVPIIVDVENTSENYNKNWQFYIKVDQYAGGDGSGTATFQYDYNLKWTIKTPPRYVPMSERPGHQQAKSEPPWLYILIGTLITGIIVTGFAIRRHKPGKKYEEQEEDIFKK